MNTSTTQPTARKERMRPTEPLPRLLFTREESARILGMSLSHFQRHAQPYLKCVYSGQLRLYRPDELKAWAEREACDPAASRGVSR